MATNKSIEEKAKAYDEAIKVAKSKIKNDKDHVLYENDIIEIFPELSESKDERIRKALLDWYSQFKQNNMFNDDISFKDILNWLERQGEHKEVTYLTVIHIGKSYKCIAVPRYTSFKLEKIYKPEDVFVRDLMNLCAPCFKEIDEKENKVSEQKPANKVEPKFKVGDLIKYDEDGEVNRVVEITSDGYKLERGSHILCFSSQDYWELVEDSVSEDEQNLPSFDESQGTPILKQGEQKPADKIEPKFHKGEWITHNTANFVFKIISFGYNGYEVVNRENYKKTISSGNEDNYHLWTIEDAKNGDVLADKYNNIGIFSRCEGICWHSYIYLGCDGELRGFSIGGRHEQIDTHPATKEQRDALMKAMADAGYTFDFEKKELKRIEQKPAAWSEEDDQYLLVCKNALAKYQVSDKWDATIISRWLENKLKASQNRWKPSERQKEALLWCVVHLGGADKQALGELLEELNKL